MADPLLFGTIDELPATGRPGDSFYVTFPAAARGLYVWGDGAGGWANEGANGGSQPSYLIVESGGTITATGCDAGLANFSGTDAPTVFQNAINALRGVGGSIWWKGKPVFATQQGTAVGGVSACIDLFPGIELRGQGPISQGTQSTSVITVTAAVNAPAIRVIVDPGNPTWPSFPVLRDFAVQGSGTGNTAQDACYIDGTNGNVLDVILDHFLVFDVGGNGLNSQSANAKVWADKCYFERCRQNGVRHAAGHLSVTKSYIQNNTLFGIDATSSDSLDAYFNKIWANAGGGAQLWSMTSGFNVAHNNFNNNGDNTHPVVILKSLTSLAKMGILEGNLMLDTRASASACQFFVNCTLGVFAEIVNNPMSGQKSGNKAINLTANASDSLVIKSNAGFNPLGSITNPLDTTNNRVGLGGSTATAVASTDYTIAHVDQYLVASGGTGVSITVKDPAGNTVESGLSSFAKVLPIGFKVNFGAFTVAPTVASFAN